MNRDEIHKTIKEYFDVIENDVYSAEEREGKLKLILDQLALIYHFVGFEFDDADYPDAPRKDDDELRETVSKNFPNFGLYNVANDVSVKIGESSISVGDAINDICDIANDLSEVLWCWENTSVEDALWHFRQSYEYHWIFHLRELQLYLIKKPLDL